MPWHLRPVFFEHERRYSDLLELHSLTEAWAKISLREESVTTSVATGLLSKAELREDHDFWMLDHLAEKNLSEILDDCATADTLIRLDQVIRHSQALVLRTSKAAHREELQQAAWKQGRLLAEARWPVLSSRGSSELREILQAFNHSPLSGAIEGRSFLVRRLSTEEVQAELLHCPHRLDGDGLSHWPEELNDDLCIFQSHWMRGFAYALNNRARLEQVIQTPRCLQRWTLDS